jgi:hypothetical protein
VIPIKVSSIEGKKINCLAYHDEEDYVEYISITGLYGAKWEIDIDTNVDKEEEKKWKKAETKRLLRIGSPTDK